MINIVIELFSGLFKGVLGLIGDILIAVFASPNNRKETLDANFLSPRQANLSVYNKGFSANGRHHVSIADSSRGALVLGATGTGKSVTVCIPTTYNLLRNGHSLCLHDPSGELYTATAAMAHSLGYTIKIIHYSNPAISDGFNPMARADDVSSIQKVASLLVRNALGENNKDPFWSSQSILLLSLLMQILKKQNFWFQNFVNVKRLLDSMNANPEALDVLVAKCNDRQILNEYKQFITMDKKLITSVISTCRSALSILSDPTVQTVTAFDSVDFEAFRKGKVILYIQNKIGDTKYFSVLSAIYFEQCFNFLMDKLPEKGDNNVFFVIDEASSLYIPSLQIALSNLRKFRCGIMCLAQDFSQFVHLYGTSEAEAIKINNYLKVFFSGQSTQTCEELEKILGVFEFTDKDGVRRTRNLMNTDEIRAMPKNTSLILTGSNRVIYSKMYPYYKNTKYRKYSKLPLPELKPKTPFEELPLIPLPTKLTQ